MEHLIELILNLNSHSDFEVKTYKEPCSLLVDGKICKSSFLGNVVEFHKDGSFSYFLDPEHSTIGEALIFFNTLIKNKIEELNFLSDKINKTIGDIDREIVTEKDNPLSYRLLVPKVDIILETDEYYGFEWTSCKDDPNCGHSYTHFMLPIRRKM